MKKLVLFFIVFLVGLSAIAQKVEISKEKVVIDGEKFYLHTVKKGETLYAISKAYNVEINTIDKFNSGSIQGIKLDQVLKIPIADTDDQGLQEEEKDEENYIYHKVKRKETVYALTKEYEISEEEFYENNPKVKDDGLKVGMEIKIPRELVWDAEKENFTEQPRDTINFYYHSIALGETLFRLSKKYNVSKGILKKQNPKVDWNDLKIGQEIIIPKEKLDLLTWPGDVDTVTNVAIDSIILDSVQWNDSASLNLTLLLPFSVFSNMKQLYNQSLQSKEMALYPLSEKMLHFYSGLLIAIDSLEKTGLHLNVEVIDCGKDTIIIKRLIEEGAFKDQDIIIGPVFQNQRELLAKNITNNTILINPFTKCSVSGNSNMFCVIPPEIEYYKTIAKYCSNNVSCNYIIISDKIDDRVASIKAELILSFSEQNKSDSLRLKQLAFTNGNVSILQNMMLPDCRNVVIIPDHNEIYVSQVMSKLSQVEDAEIQLIGAHNWLNYNSIEIGYFGKLHFAYASPFFVNYSNPSVKSFVNSYRELYYTEPVKYSFEGYDLGLNLLKIYMQYKSFIIEGNSDPLFFNGLATDYSFKPYVPSEKFINTYVNIVGVDEDFNVRKLFPSD